LVGGNILGFLLYALYIGADGGLSVDEMAPVIVPLFFIVTLAHLRFIYRSWSSIRDGRPRMTPGKAVGLLFVPIFNIYWVFHVYGGFATDYNAYIERKHLSVSPLSRGLLAWNAFLLLVPIPVISWIVETKTVSRVCRAVNDLQASEGAAAAAS